MALSDKEAQRFELIARSPTEEILTRERLAENIANKVPLVHYIGFEVSGFVHIGTGLMGMAKVADFQAAGAETNIFLADYHTWINKKLGGDLSLIRKVAGTYFKESLRLSLKCMGGDPDKVKFTLGSELYSRLNIEYLESVLKTSAQMSLGRAKRSITVLGRREGDDINLAQLIYVPMQVADIFSQGVNLAHAGKDQRKAHVVALDVAGKFDYSPVAVHHHLLMGIQMTEAQRGKLIAAKQSNDREAFENEIIDIKMSKSNPNSAIFIHDTEEEISKKIMGAFCPSKELEVNPVIDFARYIVWPYLRNNKREFEMENGKTAKRVRFADQAAFEKAYLEGEVHPVDLKKGVAEHMTEILAPARRYFLEGNGRKYLDEMREIKITR